jgi:hypothetical protein
VQHCSFLRCRNTAENTGDHFPDAETSLIGTFHFFPVTETSHSPIISLPKQLRPALVSLFPSLCCNTIRSNFPFPVAETPIVQQLFIHFPDAETPLFSILFIPFPSSFPLPIIDETIPSSNCFASFVAETPFTSNLSSYSSMMLKHRRSAPSDSLPILKHQLSAVLHHNFSIFLCCRNTRFPLTASFFASQRQYKQQAVT